MDDLLKTALLGTAKGPAAPTGDHPVDALAAQLAADSPERVLLLRAGLRAVYHTAGQVPEQSAAVDPAPEDTRPPCSPRAGEILAKLITYDPRDLLLEALERLDGAGQRLPPELLPKALGERAANIRQALRPVLGERGRWLAHFNDAWRWAADASASAETATADLPPDAEEIWKEGTFPVRLALLERVRRVEPKRARQWLADAWPDEKADQRATFLEKLSAGLSPEDEIFLEAALDDRSMKVRTAAVHLLARLPESVLAQRMLDRADSMLAYEPPKAGGRPGATLRSLVGRKPQTGTLTVLFPKKFGADWERDGIQEKAPSGVGLRSFWLSQVLTRVAPSHWEAVFQAAPEELIRAAEACEDGLLVLDAWTQAAVDFQAHGWAPALWDFWYRHQPPRNRGFALQTPETWLTRLLALLTPAAMEARVLQVLEQPRPGKSLRTLILESLPTPWGVTVARQYLAGLQAHFADIAQDVKAAEDDWYMTMIRAAVALPEECFAEALGDLGFPRPEKTASRAGRDWHDQLRSIIATSLDQFREILSLRKELMEQITL